jgi:hypothetical protein
MAAEREAPTAADYVVTALSPLLIMLMVGSLVFFLVEVLYEGKYSERLLYTLFFFVIGAVLVARIAIETDAARASLYGMLLGIVTYIALLTYVEYPGGGWLKSFGWLVNLVLMLLIWLSAHRLTWDCTHIDEKRKGAGRGLLSAAGLDADETDRREEEPAAKPAAKKRKGKKKHESQLWSWIERYQKHREAQRNGPHTPGVWVIYFALAALPLFALGQSLVDPADEARRRATFLQMAVYVGSALALLVTTSLLALRRYLRQRKAKVPMTITAAWLGFGGVLIAIFLVVGAFLPRPHSEVPWFGIPRAGKSERDASRYAWNKDSAGKGEGAGGNTTEAGDGSASARNGKAGGDGDGEKGSGGKGQKGKGASGKQGSSGESQDEQQQKGETKKSGSEDKWEDARRSRDGQRRENEARDKAEGRDNSGSTRTSGTQLGAIAETAARLLKWVVFAVVAVLVLIAVAVAVLRYLAPFTDWAQRLLDALRNWWASLFGGGKKKLVKAELVAEASAPSRPPPFSDFANPFGDGSALRWDVLGLSEYTFLALESWAWEHEAARELMETPLEFSARLGELFPGMAEAVRQFARLHTRLIYSELAPPVDTLAILEAMWDAMGER